MPRRANKNKKKTTNSGLGRAIRNKYGGKPNRENHASGRVKRKDHLIDSFASTANHQNDRNFKSITECNNIQQFIDTMSYEQKEEDEEEDEMKLISYDPQESMESKEKRYHSELKKTESFNYENLPIPRKPSWNENTTKQELLSMEEKVFVNWRRGLANTAKETNLEMTPFEKNIQVWKQLWKVIEISHLLILIVDARNPLAFISRDLFKYVSEVSNDKKQCILLINKADYLSPLQRKYWMQYFKQQNIKILYFSAMKEEIKLNLLTKSNRDKLSLEQIEIVKDNTTINNDNNSIEDILSCDKLIKIFESFKIDNMDKLKVGLIGYPNVGKSSIINVLMKSKRVSTGSTPGKTKHFQTLNLNDNIILCDCPGLVFPTLVNSKSDMILNGVIPIDNLTDFITPTRLMVHRVSIKKINNYYNLRLPINNKKQIKFITVYDVLDSYCHQKKMYNKSKVPNRNEAARILLKDYVKGKLIYNHYPPNLNSRNKFLFYNGKNNINHNDDNDDNDNDDDDNNEVIDNVLDQNKLNNIDNVEEEEEDEDEEEEDEDETQEQEGMTDLEFLELWKHPMEEYGDSLGTSKKKHEKKVRVMRRIEKKTQKQNRKYRRDADNYLYGSNAVIVSSVPTIKGKHSKVQL